MSIIIWLSVLPSVLSSHKCISVVTPDFSLCTSGEATIHNLTHRECQNVNPVCNKGLNISYVQLTPFSHKRFTAIINEIIHHCCGSCVQINRVNNIKNLDELSISSLDSIQIVYPVLGEASASTLYGYHFIPLWNAPGAYYITQMRTQKMVMESLIKSYVKLWPLFIIMLLTALTAGFIIWLIETWANKEMFQRTFLIGLFDGFWWSFVSMTTVGYGDKIPKLLISRIFSIFWIFIGISLCSMFTASLTKCLTDAAYPEEPSMEGKVVGVIKQRLYDATLVAEHGGIIKETKGLDPISDVKDLIRQLKNHEISGFLLDKFSYLENMHYFDTRRITSEDAELKNIFTKETLITEVENKGEELLLGALAKEKETYEFFKHFVQDNRRIIKTCSYLHMNKLHERVHSNIHHSGHPNVFSSYSGLPPSPCFYAILALLVFILLFGTIYEILRLKVKKVPNAKKFVRSLRSYSRRTLTSTTDINDTVEIT